MQPEITVYLGLGSNLGDRLANLQKSIASLKNIDGITPTRNSSVYLTEPVGVTRQPDFYNAVVEVKTTLSPHSLLAAVKKVEHDMGREPNNHFKPRPIDLDILIYGDSEIDTMDLLIPHSRLTKRAFVLIPLLELNPELIHPTSFKPLKEYLTAIGDTQKIERVVDAGIFTGKPEEN